MEVNVSMGKGRVSMKAIFLLLLLTGCSSEEQPVAQQPVAQTPSNDAWVMPEVDLGDNQAAQPEVVADDYDDNSGDGSGGTYTPPSTYPSAYSHPAPTPDQGYSDQIRAQQAEATRQLYQNQRQNSETNRQLYQNQRQNMINNRPKW
jgi:hypothetical protein